MGVSKTRPFVLGTITHALHSVDLSRLGDQAMHQSDVTVTCRWCENSQRVSERKAGTTVKCSKCGNSIAVAAIKPTKLFDIKPGILPDVKTIRHQAGNPSRCYYRLVQLQPSENG